MTEPQLMLVLAHESVKNEDPKKDEEKKQEEEFNKRLKVAQERSLERQKSRSEMIKEAQEKILKNIEDKKAKS